MKTPQMPLQLPTNHPGCQRPDFDDESIASAIACTFTRHHDSETPLGHETPLVGETPLAGEARYAGVTDVVDETSSVNDTNDFETHVANAAAFEAESQPRSRSAHEHSEGEEGIEGETPLDHDKEPGEGEALVGEVFAGEIDFAVETPHPRSLIYTFTDAITWHGMQVLLDVQLDMQLTRTDLFDPRWLARWCRNHPGLWPEIGVAGPGWGFGTFATEGDRVCPLAMALESRRSALVESLIVALALDKAGAGMTHYAGLMVERGLARIGTADFKHSTYLRGIACLVAHGARMPRGIQIFKEVQLSYCGVFDAATWSKLHGEAPAHLTFEAPIQTSALASLLFCDIYQDHGLGALQALMQHYQKEMQAFREVSCCHGTILHLCVIANRCDALNVALNLADALLLSQADDKGRTALDLAVMLGHYAGAQMLRAFDSRQCALLALNEV